MMSCPKNRKRILFGRVELKLECKFKIDSIGKFMFGVSKNFMVHSTCELCGRNKTEHFVSWDELLRRGVDNETIKKACHEWVNLMFIRE